MNKKRTIIVTLIVLILLIVTGVIFVVVTREDENTTLNMMDKQWIESNKNQIIDLALPNNIPVFNYNGNGVFFNFLNALETDTKLDFNLIPYNYQDEVKSQYAFQIKESKTDKDLLFFTDYYVLVGLENQKYNRLEEIKEQKIGVLTNDFEKIENIFKEEQQITFKTYETVEDLFSALFQEEKEVTLLAVPRILSLEKIIKEDALNIVYGIPDLKQYYVLSLGENEKLNSILEKYASRWVKNNFTEEFNTNFNQNYFTFMGIEESQKAKFRSKKYSYGFIKNAPFDYVIDGKLLGYNSAVIKDFASIASIELELHDFSSIEELVDAFNDNDLDFVWNNFYGKEYKMDTVETVSINDEAMVIVSPLEKKEAITSLESLKDTEVLVLKDSKALEYIDSKQIPFEAVATVDELLTKYTQNSTAVIEEDVYNYYKNKDFATSKIDYRFYLPSNYTYVIRSISENQLFIHYFNFYLSFMNELEMKNMAYYQLVNAKTTTTSLRGLLLLGALLLVVCALLFILVKIIPKRKTNKKVVMSKAEKLKYIDMLTSLKNRNYLNDNIEAWDDAEVYPQTIIIVDLNNLAYINDNYGHAEGDSVIREAANILIKNQMENSEIIRTNGNEFLIYLVGYDEKHIVSYVRKLTKELKDLAHGFGAAAGYSMINDAIKTIDDAVNEATLDMKSNKEELKS